MISDYVCVKSGAYVHYDGRVKETLLLIFSFANVNLYLLDDFIKIYATVCDVSASASAFQDYL